MIFYYDDELGEIIADECSDCEHSYVDDLFFEWMCRRNRCKYTKDEQKAIIEKTKAEWGV